MLSILRTNTGVLHTVANCKLLNFKKLLGFVACKLSKTLRNRSMFSIFLRNPRYK